MKLLTFLFTVSIHSIHSFRLSMILVLELSQLQVKEAKVTEAKINEIREYYRPAAARASLLYFIMNDLNKINPMYQFSLKVSHPSWPTCQDAFFSWRTQCVCSLLFAGFQRGVPESGEEGRARGGSAAASVQFNRQHHLLSLPVHHQRPIWVWQAHVRHPARLPGRKEKSFYLLLNQ